MIFNVFYIQKKAEEAPLAGKFARLIAPYARLREQNVFSKAIAAAQSAPDAAAAARAATTQAFMPHLAANAYNIALSEDGAQPNSLEFAAQIAAATLHTQEVNFFIGGAYGLEDAFKRRCCSVLSLSRLTTSHLLARSFLLEQIYRACAINAGHPYHK